MLNSKTRAESKKTVGAGLSGLETFIAAKFLTKCKKMKLHIKILQNQKIYIEINQKCQWMAPSTVLVAVSVSLASCRTFLIAL